MGGSGGDGPNPEVTLTPATIVPEAYIQPRAYGDDDDDASSRLDDDDDDDEEDEGIRIRNNALDPNEINEARQQTEHGNSSAVSLSDAVDYSRRVT